MSFSEPLTVFYQLLDTNGHAFENCEVSVVSVSQMAFLNKLRNAVFDENKHKLAAFDVADLKVFATLNDLDQNKQLRHCPAPTVACIAGEEPFYNTIDNPLYVVVPSKVVPLADGGGTVVLSEQSKLDNPPQPDECGNAGRQKRWDQLNAVLQKNKKMRMTSEGMHSTDAYSAVSWAEIRHVYDPITKPYNLIPKALPDEDLDTLLKYLTYSGMAFEKIQTGSEALRLHFIAPILVFVCKQFGGEIKILAEESLDGKSIHVNGRFEFILEKKEKRICILEAKREDFQQGMAQDLLGCEAVADLQRLDCVYGIVTNYVNWIFLRSLDNQIESINAILPMHIGTQTPDRQYLSEIAGCIYAMLSDDE